MRRAERGEPVAVIPHGDHVADIVPSGELDRLRVTIEVLSDTELVRDIREGLAAARRCGGLRRAGRRRPGRPPLCRRMSQPAW